MFNLYRLTSLVLLVGVAHLAEAKNLAVGPGQSFTDIGQALTNAVSGDTILVYPKPDNQPYERVALYLSKPRIAIKAVRGNRKERIPLSGRDYNYSGWGMTPRAIVQFSRGSDGSYLEGFELYDAHNDTGNGAGVRIDKANDITIRDCTIHDNDMGIMSNGDGTTRQGVNQRIEGSLIYANGAIDPPRFGHNLYLGGTSVTLIGSEVHTTVTGHNIKSRAHRTVIMACFIHDSANRELDLVDAEGDTDVPDSDVVLAGNIIVKGQIGSGNRQVIHFGRDGHSQRNGTLYLLHNNIISPFGTPLIHVSSATARVRMFNNIIWDGGQTGNRQNLLDIVDGREASLVVSGGGNWFSSGFAGEQLNRLHLQSSFLAPRRSMPRWADPSNNDYRLLGSDPTLAGKGMILPPDAVNAMGMKLRYYAPHQGSKQRTESGTPAIGAYPFAVH
ncbi:MAG: hypothetical protein ACU83N_04595 [Gammaproteobacteria bacterium]